MDSDCHPALDNRPLKFEESTARFKRRVYVSATPADYERDLGQDNLVELIARPTGLVDPEIEVRPAGTQVDDLMDEIRQRIESNERVLVTTLTKRMAEDLSEYYTDLGLRVRYLHADISTLERIDIIRDLRRGEFDVLIGINLLREGLDIPEVSLVAILDADKEGFLRSTRSLIQTCGRAARNVRGKVIMYADRVTHSMQQAISETERRRSIQMAYNKKHGITPQTIQKEIVSIFDTLSSSGDKEPNRVNEPLEGYRSIEDIEQSIQKLEKTMLQAAHDLEFERAAKLRDRIQALKARIVFDGRI